MRHITKGNFQVQGNASARKSLGKAWCGSVQFAFVHILEVQIKTRRMSVPKIEIMPYVRKLSILGEIRVICMTEAIPFCLMQWYEWAIAEYHFMPETTVVWCRVSNRQLCRVSIGIKEEMALTSVKNVPKILSVKVLGKNTNGWDEFIPSLAFRKNARIEIPTSPATRRKAIEGVLRKNTSKENQQISMLTPKENIFNILIFRFLKSRGFQNLRYDIHWLLHMRKR